MNNHLPRPMTALATFGLVGLLAVSLVGCKSDDAKPDQADDAPAAAAKEAPEAAKAPEAAAANSKCPIMGTPIDPKNVPASLTRTFDGKKIGFCCAGCPVAWDKLTDEMKRAKLAADAL